MLVSNGTIRPPLIMYLFEILLFAFFQCYNDNLVNALIQKMFRGWGDEKFRFPGGGGVSEAFFREFYYANLINFIFSEGVGVAFRSAHEVCLTLISLFFQQNTKAYPRLLYNQ